MNRNFYTVILVPGADARVSALVPAMPGCFSQGNTRDDALTNAVEAMTLWTDVEGQSGRVPLAETPAVVASAVREALEVIDQMRQAGELADDAGYQLELAAVHPRQRATA